MKKNKVSAAPKKAAPSAKVRKLSVSEIKNILGSESSVGNAKSDGPT